MHSPIQVNYDSSCQVNKLSSPSDQDSQEKSSGEHSLNHESLDGLYVGIKFDNYSEMQNKCRNT